MGSAKHNFYNAAFRRGGYEDVATEAQRLWLDGKREQAIERIPDDMVMQTSLLGDDETVRERIRSYAAAGVTTLMLQPVGKTLSDRLDTLAHAIDLVRAEGKAAR